MSDKVYWIWLSLACTPDTPTFAKLIASFDTPEEIYNATDREIRSAVGARVSDCTRLVNKDLADAERILDFCESKGVGILTYSDDKYPESLRSIPTPPVLLYYRGTVPDFNSSFSTAIVGTRSLSDYGRRNAFKLGYDMASAGSIVVSGMAIGIDSVAHAGALAANGTTVAVIGSGIDVCYPSQHQTLARAIVKHGCVFTEYAPGTKPNGYNFPRRNRIISGLSDVTVVVEGREKSGALLTARHANAQERPVYAFPGNVDNAGSQVTNLLIKTGAKLCTAADDILRDYEKECPPRLNVFNLKERIPVDMMAVLTEYKVACVTPSDDIFRAARPVRGATGNETKELQKDEEQQISSDARPESDMQNFDKKAINLYTRIPLQGDCEIESLVDENLNLREVMKLLFKLEVGRFVKILPGERVKRNTF